MQMEIRSALKMSNTFAVINRRTTNNAVDFIALGKKEFREIGAVLASDTSNERNIAFGHNFSF